MLANYVQVLLSTGDLSQYNKISCNIAQPWPTQHIVWPACRYTYPARRGCNENQPEDAGKGRRPFRILSQHAPAPDWCHTSSLCTLHVPHTWKTEQFKTRYRQIFRTSSSTTIITAIVFSMLDFLKLFGTF